jgi:hypothetical protein
LVLPGFVPQGERIEPAVDKFGGGGGGEAAN